MTKRKIVAIAGASSGTGKAMAEMFAARGYPVALAARRGKLLEEIADSITRSGGKALPVPTDLGKWEETRDFIQHTVQEFGGIDVLVNNAGWGIRSADFDELSSDEIDQGLSANLLSVLFGCRAALPYMKKQQSGQIINVSSILGKRSRSGLALYTGCKHAVEGFSRSLMNEVSSLGIRVSIFAPAAIHTPWAEKAGITLPEEIHFLDPQDIAKAILYIIETPEHVNVWNMDLISREQRIDPL